MVTGVPAGGLTSLEDSLIKHVGWGEWLDLAADDDVIDEAAMQSWDDSRTCRASVIRDILRGKQACEPDPHGLRLRGARILGRLDLQNLATQVNLELHDCFLEEGILARYAQLCLVSLRGCRIEHPAEPPLDAERLTCSMLNVSDTTITGRSIESTVRLVGAHIVGPLLCNGASLRNDSGPALNADSLQVDERLFLRAGFTAHGAGLLGAVRLVGARIGGQLSCSGARLHNDTGPALVAQNLQVGQLMELGDQFTATGNGKDGAVQLIGARIESQLSCSGASLHNDIGPALNAQWLQVGAAMFLSDGFTAHGAGPLGAVRLDGAHIGTQLSFMEASLCNDTGPALAAQSLQVGEDMFLERGFTATGNGEAGAVRLDGAHIGAQLSFKGASLCNDTGPALVAESLQVGGVLWLDKGFSAIGGGKVGDNPWPVVNLMDARVGEALWLDPAQVQYVDNSAGRLAVSPGGFGVEGLTYAGVPEGPEGSAASQWLELLRKRTPYYHAQPYQQLAAAYRAYGHDSQARKILMAQRDDQLARVGRDELSLPEWWWGKITKLTLGYGYQPWRALLFLAGVILLSCWLAVALGSHGALAQTEKTANKYPPCTVVQRVSVGLDLNLPVGTSLARPSCDLTKNSSSATATGLIVAGWVLRVLAWVFAALFIAGFTSAIRKT